MSAESVAVTPRAPGVEYFPSALDPKIELFRCPSYRICLTAAACSKSWLKVQETPKYGIHSERAACRLNTLSDFLGPAQISFHHISHQRHRSVALRW
jgi:hypothetical protein